MHIQLDSCEEAGIMMKGSVEMTTEDAFVRRYQSDWNANMR